MKQTSTPAKGAAAHRQKLPAGMPAKSAILFFDGVCGLCHRAVNFVLSHDRTGRFLFAPLQGETAAVWLSSEDVTRLHSLVLVAEGRVYRKSAAVVRILCRLSLPWAMAGCLLWLIPGPLRDAGYDLVARYRYRIFGKHETCRLPTTADRARFLE